MTADGRTQGVVVRLRGLPSKTTKADVLAFLDGLNPVSVHLHFKERRSAGEAYIVFASFEEAQQACNKDKDIFSPKFGERYVRVVIAEDTSPDDLANQDGGAAKAMRSRRANQKMESVVKVCGLPSSATTADVLQLFWGFTAKASGTYIQPAANDPHAEAYVDFEVVEHAAQAVATRHGTMVTTSAGIFQLSVQKATKAEWEAVVAAQQGSDGIVKLKGLPTKASAADVAAFFEGYHIKEGGVHVQPFSENRHSKIALVEFETAAEAQRALERDRQRFAEAYGDRYCLLQLVHRAEFEQELRKFQRQAASAGGTSSSGGGTQGAASLQALSAGGSMGAGVSVSVGMMPQAAAAAGFMHPALPNMGAGMMLPAGYTVPAAMAAMPGSWPAAAAMPAAAAAAAAHMQHYLPGAAAAAAAVGMPGAPGMLPGVQPGAAFPPWGAMPAAGNTAAARYMVQDLSTGQKVFLDPRFNLSAYGYGGLPPSGLPSSSAAATAGTTAMGTTATGATSHLTHSQVTMSENSIGAKSSGQGTAGTNGNGTSSAPTTGNGTSSGPTTGIGNGSSGNGHSVALAASNGHSVAVAGGNGTSGGTAAAGYSAGPADGSGGSGGSGSGSGQGDAGEASGQPHASRHRHSHHHHHHAHHHHHHHHYHAQQQSNGNGGGSSGDEGRTNGGSGGGSNEGSDGGNSSLRADRPGGNGQGSNKSGDGDNSSGNEDGRNDGRSSGEGSGADDGATARTAAGAGAAASRAQYASLGFDSRLEPAGATAAAADGPGAMDEDVTAADTLPAPHSSMNPAAADAASADHRHGLGHKDHAHAPDASALQQDGVALPRAKRTRSQ